MKKILKKIYLLIKKVITKFGQLISYFGMLIMKPARMLDLIKNVKHGNLAYGCYTMDKLYFKKGKITLDGTNEPVVSIIIPVFNQIDYTYQCLMSIEKNTNDVPYEVIIGDDVSFDGTKYIDRYVENIRVNKNSKNTGFLLNCNNAAKKARGKYILFLNNDTEVCENWLSSLVELIESDESIGMVGSKLIYPNGRLQEAGGVILSDGSGRNYGGQDDPNKPQYNYVRDVDYISGASIMISQKLWKQLGGFDKRYVPAYCEDSDLAFAVRKAGYRVVYQPKSVVIHYEGISNGRDVNNTSGLKHYQIKNNLKLKEKWAEEFKQQPHPSVENDNFKSRDRIKEKGMILVVDHYVPEYDKDAGSRTTFQYLKMFVEEGYTVKFLPDNFYQNEPYTTKLEQMGIEVLYGDEYANGIFEWLDKNKQNIDVVYLNRPNIAPKYIDYFKNKTDIKIIYYGHDLHFLREMREYELTGDEEKLNASNNSKKLEFSIMEKADCVYYPSYVEEEAIKKINPGINVKAINAYLFDDVDLDKAYNFKSKKGIMFVGGFNHTPNVDGIKWFMEEVYPIIKKKKNIPFTIAGSNPPQLIKDYANDDVTVTGFISDEELAEIYDNSRIVVAPLRYGAGIKGKVVEAMAKGMPVVTTSIGAEGLVNTEDILMVEDNPKKFAEAILKLYDDEEKLNSISKNTRKYIVDNYSTKAAWNIIKNDFSKKVKYTIINLNNEDNGEEISNFLQLSSFDNVGDIRLINLNEINLVDTYENENLVVETCNLNKIHDYIRSTHNVIILAKNYIDGSFSKKESLKILNECNYVAKSMVKCHIIGKFNSNTSNEILEFINKMNDNVNFYLTDEESLRNFELLTGKNANYLPELVKFVKRTTTNDTIELVKKLIDKMSDKKLVGINITNDIENITEYLKNILNSIKDNVYYIIIDNSGKEGINKEVSKLLKDSEYMLINNDYSYGELLNVLSLLNVLINSDNRINALAANSNIISIPYLDKDELNEILKDNTKRLKEIRNNNYIENSYIEAFKNKLKAGE